MRPDADEPRTPSVRSEPTAPGPAPEAEYFWATTPGGEPFPPPPADGGPREGAGTGRQMSCLLAWLGAEQAYAEGHLADATLSYLQDEVSRVIGRGAESQLVTWVQEHDAELDDLRTITEDTARCQALLRHLLARTAH